MSSTPRGVRASCVNYKKREDAEESACWVTWWCDAKREVLGLVVMQMPRIEKNVYEGMKE